jgi:hypothetical protein
MPGQFSKNQLPREARGRGEGHEHHILRVFTEPTGREPLSSGGPSPIERLDRHVRCPGRPDALSSGGHDKEALDDLYARNKAASCTVAATQPYDFNDDHSDSDAQELADAIGTEAVEAMRRAVSSYEIYTSAQRSRPSYQFQEDVWEVLGELAGGLMEDPQSGSYQIYENGSKREIEPASAPDIEPSDIRSLLTRFIDRARERGFPVSGQGGNAGVVTDELDLARMEELLKLASTCVPADPAFSLSEELLDEYVSNKGESFETQHGDWIEAMRNCRWSGGSTEGGPRPGPIGFLRRLFLRKGGQ